MIEEENKGYQELIVKFLAGEISDEEINHLKSSIEKNAETRRIFDEKNELWQESDIRTKLGYYKTDVGWRKITSKLGIGETRYNKSVLIIDKYKFRLLLVAAS